MRHISVCMEKVRDVNRFPLQRVNLNGRTHTLNTIFNPAGIHLTVSKGDSDLAQPNTSGSFNRNQLKAYLSCYHQGGGSADIYLLCVHKLRLLSGGSWVSDVLGVMFDHSRWDNNLLQRQGCAISSLAIENPRKALRTMAHELGHAMNLCHHNASQNSVMTPTSDLPDTIYWNAAQFGLSLSSKQHLRGPIDQVMPGRSPARACILNGTDVQNSSFDLQISAADVEYLPGQPLILRVQLKNHTQEPRDVRVDLSTFNGHGQIRLMDTQGFKRPFHQGFQVCRKLPTYRLQAGESIRADVILHRDQLGFCLAEPGSHKFQMTVAGMVDQGQWVHWTSNQLEIHVSRLGNNQARHLSDCYMSRDWAKLFQGDTSVPERALNQIPEAYRNTPAYIQALLARAENLMFLPVENARLRQTDRLLARYKHLRAGAKSNWEQDAQCEALRMWHSATLAKPRRLSQAKALWQEHQEKLQPSLSGPHADQFLEELCRDWNLSLNSS